MLSVAMLFNDYMVLQQGEDTKIWGKGIPQSEIEIKIQDKVVKTTADHSGNWIATMNALYVSEDETVTITSGEESIVIEHVAVGEVWIASGQSNMEFLLKYDEEAEEVISHANHPQIRFFDYPKTAYNNHLLEDDFSDYGVWRPLSKENAPFYSAIPYYFANKLYEELKIPIGIVGCTWGGTPACAWAAEDILKSSSASIWIEEYKEAVKELDIKSYEKDVKENPMFKRKIKDYHPMIAKMNKGMTEMEVKSFMEKVSAMDIKPEVMGPLSPLRPTGLYENMVKYIAPYTNKGVLWYQGESDDNHADIYDEALKAVIYSFRELWHQELPFLLVELAPFERWFGTKAIDFVTLREQQEKVANTLEHVYITNIMDAGMQYDIHPKKKRPAGERLALLALGKIYGKDIVCEAPEVISVQTTEGKILINFKNVGSGLIKEEEVDAYEVMIDNKRVTDYEIDITKDSLVVLHKDITINKSIHIKYGKKNYCICNIKNSNGIPVKPFEISGEN